jgi:hypothetical protein
MLPRAGAVADGRAEVARLNGELEVARRPVV